VTQLLLDDRLAPITSDIGFLETDVETAVAAYLEWQDHIRIRHTRVTVEGTLEDLLSRLLPLQAGAKTRSLWVPTVGGWTAYFDNGSDGPDPFPPMSFLAGQLGRQGLRAAAVVDTMDEQTRRGRYGASILEVYGSLQEDGSNTVRSICGAHDGDRWTFEAFGEVLPFENPSRYEARRAQDRFPIELLDDYLHALGVHAFDSAFYAPDRRAVLLERRRRF